MTTMVVMELIDTYGKLECALFGEYVNDLRNFLNQGDHVQVIAVVQLARVKTFRVLPEHGVLDVEPLAIVLDNSREGLEADFMKLHPRKSIAQLSQIQEDGMFVVLASIVDIVHDGPWFYLACKCNRWVTVQSTVHFCENCGVPVLQVSPRFKVKVEVSDQNNTAVFVLFNCDMSMLIKKTCEGLLIQKHEDVTGDGYPCVFDSLIGQRILFKVETKVAQSRQFKGSYPMRRVCVDKDVIGMFDLEGADLTPTKQINSGILVTPIALGDDEFASKIKCTPAKRKLDADFASCQVVTGEPR